MCLGCAVAEGSHYAKKEKQFDYSADNGYNKSNYLVKP